MQYVKSGNTIALRVDYGEEILEKINEVCVKENIKTAAISGIGATKETEIGLYNMETGEYKREVYTGLYEVGSLIGNITEKDSKPYIHLHIVIGDTKKDAVHCGHLNRAVVGATSEIFITVFEHTIGRKFDEQTGINIFEF
ncbi:DNA-binding protein [Peptacetobacter hominis]|uniref:DNA-binding protein n=1 Tax=Peptacetobacter hominis TaxID=2743610 RepID=A0A544QW31_9FIRM|nr:DUF296 domain-containing protein [Peptacetobacter hominis]TQQ84886.1 DNA-binding protein [Peptacetobacter hominis]